MTAETIMPDQKQDGSKAGKGSMSVAEAGRLGGRSQGKENNPGNFANDPEKAREAGRHSHDNDSNRGGSDH
jgi:hypothetical protein